MWWKLQYDEASERRYERVVKALQRDGWVVVRQKGSHIRLHKHTRMELLKLTIPAHRPIKRSTLAQILKQARLTIEEFESLL
ncbi:MAG: type II toxin-antitoxin system HicA family toxin [Syntrophobacteraceae bacterium]|jgi:predicted RNA binding protein YcfA (HicA-like mRNA interferase family)|nr:type II toxin-antitoxin system HicA family toxin [Syntrophobacteraceae bacterium]